MQRNARALIDTTFDVLVVGGGAFGAAAARSAALRGLKTALIERADFGSGASAECFKMVHGGIRYLQHLDVVRARASCRERSALLRTAPHLVKPLPIAIPTYGRGRRGKLFLGAGLRAYDVLTWDRNRGIRDPARRIGPGRFLSRTETLELFPHLDSVGLTGAAIFEDGQMHNPARLVLAFVKSAVAAGAVACNYVEAKRIVFDGRTAIGAEVEDRLDGERFVIRARGILNAAGPWAEYLFDDASRFGAWQRSNFSRDAYFIIDRPPSSSYALAIPGLSRDQDAVLSRANRHLFLVPWRDKTLVGVWHRLFPQSPDAARIEEPELEQWLEEINAVNPNLKLARREIVFSDCGLVPFGDHADDNALQFGKESRLIDHRQTHGIGGLVTLIGIRYTMARADAERALDALLAQQEKRPPQVDTQNMPLAGGAIADIQAFRSAAHANRPAFLSEATLDSLLCNHGTDYLRVLERATAEQHLRATVPRTNVLAAEVEHAIEEEMAVHLSDIVLRRTDMSGHEHPGRAALEFTAECMARYLGWSAQRISDEISDTEAALARHHAVDRTGAADRVQNASVGSMLAKLSA
jgi:glycerol-3-phosphate dehydrogenase